MKKVIDPFKTPQAKNVRFIKWLEKQNLKAYRLVGSFIVEKILDILQAEGLSKSELPRGWTGEVPKIEMDVLEVISPVMDKYLQALKWLAIGKYAGKDAEAAAKEVGLHKDFVPGSVVSSYLHAIDTELEYTRTQLEMDPKNLPKNLMESTISNLVKAADPSVEHTLSQIKSSIMHSVVNIIENHNSGQTKLVLDESGNLDASSKDKLAEIADKAEKYIAESDAKRALKTAIKNNERQAVLGIQDHVAKGGSTGTQQAIYEIHGIHDDELKVIWVTLEDERVCKYCDGVSKKNGKYIIYKMSDFKPYGYNRGKKQKDWVLTVPAAHPMCRCRLVYMPRGFTVVNGEIVKE